MASAEFSKFAGILSEEGIQMVNKHIKSCLTLPGSSIHGIFQERVLEWGAIALCQQMWKIQQWPQDWKRSVFIPIPKKGNAKQCSNYCTIGLISLASKEILKILQDRLQQYMNQQIPGVQDG